MVGAVDRNDERLAPDEEHGPLAERADGHREVEVGLGFGQRRLEGVGGHVVGRLDQHHHGEVP